MIGKIHFILNVIIYFMNFCAIIGLMYIVNEDKIYFQLAQQLFQNWEMGLITRIQIQHAPLCSDGMETLSANAFPGINEGCDCLGISSIPDDSSVERKITSGVCSSSALKGSCKAVKGFYKKSLSQLGNITICVERTRDYNYNKYNLNDMRSCDDLVGMRQCGEIDTIGNRLCVLSNESCPYLYNDNSDDIDESAPELLLLESLVKHNATFRDLFKKSKLIHKFQALSHLPITFFDDPITLYHRNYIGWKPKCKKYFSDLHILPILLASVIQFSPMYLISSLFILLYCLLFIMVFKEIAEQNVFADGFLIIIHLTLIISVFKMIINDYLTLFSCVELLEKVINKACSDSETVLLLVGVYQTCSELERLYFQTMTLFGLMIPISLFKYVLLLYKWYKESLLFLVLARTPLMEFEMQLL